MTSTTTAGSIADTIAASLRARNPVSRAFFDREADRLAEACREMAARFRRGGRLLAIGRGAHATDAQHVSVEFVHPVIVGKRALPALDLSPLPAAAAARLAGADDIVMGFGPPAGDDEVADVLRTARATGAQTFALPGTSADYAVDAPSPDPFVHQELIEVLYHTLWETVHVFLEHAESGHDVGAAGFLYPYLGRKTQDTGAIVQDVAASIRAKASSDEALREHAADTCAPAIADAVERIRERLADGGTLFAFGNGGSATDANDFVLDCASSGDRPPLRAISLSMEPASLTAIANDIGRDAIFLRQIIAHARPGDVALAISTSGGSTNVIAALEESRRRRLTTVALVGYDGGEIVRRNLADVALVVSCDYIPRIQEVQASIYHTMIDALRAAGAA